MVSNAVDAYSSALSLGTSVVDYLDIPMFDDKDATMASMARMAKLFKSTGRQPTPEEEDMLDEFVTTLLE